MISCLLFKSALFRFLFGEDIPALMASLYSVEHYPAEDDKLRASSVTQRRGGNTPNTLEVLKQLISMQDSAPISLALCAVLPSSTSRAVEQIKSSFGPKIDLSHCIYREDRDTAASSYIIRSQSSDSRTIINYNDLPEMSFKEYTGMAERLANKLQWCHFEVISFISYLLHLEAHSLEAGTYT